MTPEELSHELRKEAISKGHSVQTVASGYSMFPFLRIGDLLTVEPVPMETIKLGDIVVFESGGKWIAHRVINIRSKADGLGFLLRGDTCIEFDPVVNKENYIGSVRVFTRMNSKKVMFKGVLNAWNKIILAIGLVYNFPLYFMRIFIGLILSPFLKR
jgi:signal peptidase I